MLFDTDTFDSVKLDINNNISVNVQDQVKEMFKKNYSNKVGSININNPYEMEVQLKKDHLPFYFRPRRMSYNEKEKLKVIIDELLAKKIIRPSNSPYCSPIVLIKKKNK